MHLGWIDVPSDEELKDFAFLFDLFLGIPSYIYDKDRNRRKFYGALGEYRLKSYGIECRTLGAGMCAFPKIIERGLAQIQKAIQEDKTAYLKELYFDTIKMISQTNNLSVNQAKHLYKEILKDNE